MGTLSDEELKAYFLGKLSGTEAEIFEEEYALSAELTEQAQMIERELVDDYLRGTLSPADTKLFEANYLITDARRKKLAAAGGLWKLASEQPEPAPPLPVPPPPFWQTLFSRRNAFQFAVGGLLLLMVSGAAVFYLLSVMTDKPQVAEVKTENPPSKTENPPVQNPDNRIVQSPDTRTENPKSVSTNPTLQNKEASKDKEENKELNSPSKNSAEIKPVSTPKNIEFIKPIFSMAVKLLPGSLRDEGEQFVTIAPNVRSLNFLLNPAGEPNNYKIYRAILKTAEDDIVFTSPNLRSLSFKLSAEKLENRTYIIFLEGQNLKKDFESIAEYTFRVRR